MYDFENHLIQKGGVTIVYDGDGNRVSKAVAGVTTTYLVDNLNPTGYSQVVYETYSGSSAPNRELNHVYVYGLELLGQPPGHHMVYPTIGMKPDMFIWLFKSQPWRYVYNKKVKVNIS